MTDYSEFEEEEEEPKVSKENALKQIRILTKKYGIKFKLMNKKEKETKGECVETILDCVMRGVVDVSINEETGKVEVTQIIEHRSKDSTAPEKLVYGEKESKSHRAMGEIDNEFLKMDAFMSSICTTTNASIIISKLRLSDVDVKNALGTLFL